MQKLAIAVSLAAIGMLAASSTVRAQPGNKLLGLINNYRVAPGGSCNGKPARRAEPLAPNAALAKVRIAPATVLQHSLDAAGYAAERAEVIHVAGLADADAVMATVRQSYCKTLLDPAFTDVGIARNGDDWQIVFAQPARLTPRVVLPGPDAGKTILDAVNTARAAPRNCGDRHFPAAPRLAWNDALAAAALAHSRDMATHKYFNHVEKDGSVPGDRAIRAGYRWRAIAENIASGQSTVDEVVAGWLASPGHCANIMSAQFTEMGAAYAVNGDMNSGPVYWTQVFGTPRTAETQ